MFTSVLRVLGLPLEQSIMAVACLSRDKAPRSEKTMKNQRLIVGLSGASGAVYGVRALEALAELGVETHLVVTKAAEMTLAAETELASSALTELVPGNAGRPAMRCRGSSISAM